MANDDADADDVCLVANDDADADDVCLRQMMSLTHQSKHLIIASVTSNIIFATQMHHIAFGDASLKHFNFCDTIS
ncbi:MAG: hypothetical protein IJO74_00595 [Clostridia bacterium]|nr:hypothetical protein [Clostridia bacterium]